MTISAHFENWDNLGKKFEQRVKEYSDDVARASTEAARITAKDIEERGRKDIARGGNFSSARWQDGFRAKISYLSRFDIRIRITHAVKYWKVFEFGAIIRGKPLLWIPLSFAEDAKGKRARDYPGRLFRVDRKSGAPLLLSAETGEPKYFGKESVKIPKKWHLREIVRNAMKRLPQTYKRVLKNARK